MTLKSDGKIICGMGALDLEEYQLYFQLQEKVQELGAKKVSKILHKVILDLKKYDKKTNNN